MLLVISAHEGIVERNFWDLTRHTLLAAVWGGVLAALDALIAPRPERQVRGCVGVAVGLRRRTGVSARPRGSSLFRRVLRLVLVLLLSRWLRLARPRGRFVVALFIRSYRVYCTYAPRLRKGAGAAPSAMYIRMM